MGQVISAYLLIGIGVYLGCASKSMQSFKNADALSIFRGVILGLYFWPLGLYISYKYSREIK